MAFLEIRNLTSGYQGKPVFEDLSFSVEKSQFIGIIGPNGAGKTTLLKTMTHIVAPMAGSIMFNGKNIHRMRAADAAKSFAMVGQEMKSIFSFSVEEIVLMGRNPYIGIMGSERKEDLDIVNHALEVTGLLGLKQKPIDELSAGERQRAMIAKALAQSPDVLLLDEPTAHLDIGYQAEILGLVKSLLQNKGLTVICVLHDLNLASQYCDKLLIINKGRLAAFGAPKDILTAQTINTIFNTSVKVNYDIIPNKPFVIPSI